MRWLYSPWVITAAAVAGAVGLRLFLDPWLGNSLPLDVLYAAVAAAVAVGGWRAAVPAVIVGYLATDWLLMDPRGSLGLVTPRDFLRVGVFLSCSAIIVTFGEAWRRALANARRERQLAQNEASRRKEAETRYRMAAEAVNGVIYEQNWDARMVERTRGLYEVLGYRPDEVPPMAEWWDNQVHPDDREMRTKRLEEAIQTGAERAQTQYRIRHKDGRWLHIEDRAILVRGVDGALSNLHGCAVDVSELKRAEEQLRRLNAELRNADRRKDDFVATLAHELRNPLMSIRNAVQILRAKAPKEPQLEWCSGVIERQVAQMSRLLEDLLDSSRIAQGKLELRRTLVPLAEVIEAAVETSRPVIDAAGHSFALDVPATVLHVDADPVRLAQVLSNLLTNAAKYTERGGRIVLAVRQEAGGLVISVCDNGIGIAPEMRGRLFEMFTQAESALHRSQGGLGIGLSLVQGLVEMHGGEIEVKSEGVGRGSEFIVRLPLPLAQVQKTVVN